MPYVKPEERSSLDTVVRFLQSYNIQPNGQLNYILFKLCKDMAPSYNNYKNFCGELNECVAEIHRRLIAPYEDLKIQENGDVR